MVKDSSAYLRIFHFFIADRWSCSTSTSFPIYPCCRHSMGVHQRSSILMVIYLSRREHLSFSLSTSLPDHHQPLLSSRTDYSIPYHSLHTTWKTRQDIGRGNIRLWVMQVSAQVSPDLSYSRGHDAVYNRFKLDFKSSWGVCKLMFTKGSKIAKITAGLTIFSLTILLLSLTCCTTLV